MDRKIANFYIHSFESTSNFLPRIKIMYNWLGTACYNTFRVKIKYFKYVCTTSIVRNNALPGITVILVIGVLGVAIR